MSAKKRVALYGGTFDPVHVGHLDVARKISELFEIEKVLFVPAQIAPHKLGRDVTPALQRYAMLVLATQDDQRLAVSSFEIEAPDRRYTVDTVAHFVSEMGSRSELFFIMGADSWSEIATWREWQRLLTMVNHIVVTRPGYEVAEQTVMKDRIVDLRDKKCVEIEDGKGTKIFLTDAVMKDVSATQIRQIAADERFEELTGLVSTPVVQYIKKYAIYRETNED